MVWHGSVLWYSMVWCSMCDVVWNVWYDMAKYGIVSYDIVWNGVEWCGIDMACSRL